VCAWSKDLAVTFQAFDSFAKGRDALRQTVRRLAFSENSMFDGDGNLIYFQDYIKDCYEYTQEEREQSRDSDFLDKGTLECVADALKRAFAGEDVKVHLRHRRYDDDMIMLENIDNSLSVTGYGDGLYNDCLPDIQTNIFSMQEEKPYYLYINDHFGRRDCSSELYIDLRKAAVQ
jgi:hypothetical protein